MTGPISRVVPIDPDEPLVSASITQRALDLRTKRVVETRTPICGTLSEIGQKLIASGDIDPSLI
jgi:hypothetical protein